MSVAITAEDDLELYCPPAIMNSPFEYSLTTLCQ